MAVLKLQNDASIDFAWYHQLKENPDQEMDLLVRNLNPDMLHALLSVGSQVHLYMAVSGYSGTIVEPNTRGMDQILDTAADLLQKGFPRDHLILLIDPIIPTKKGIKRADEVCYQFRGIVNNVVAAPMILYPVMKKRFKEAGIKMPPGLTIKEFNEGVIPDELTILVNQWRQEFPKKTIDVMSAKAKKTLVQSAVQCFFQCPHCYCKSRNVAEEQAENDEILLK